MKCVDCSYFLIAYEPIKADGGYWDFGRAECKKYDLVTDFYSRSKLNKLECVDCKMPKEET